MDIERIQRSNTKYFGKNVLYYSEIDSTQLEAERIMKNGTENGTIIIAENQTKGKGTNDRKWYTGAENNIAMTLIWNPNCDISKIQNLTVLIAECMIKTLEQLYQYTITIKYPNDLMLQGKKLGGILTQSHSLGDQVKTVLIGIGMNVNEEAFSEETKGIATSLKQIYQRNFEREEIISKFLENLEIEIIKRVA